MNGHSSTAATEDPVLDRMLRSGLPRERAVLLTGLADDERCLFVTTEQTREELHDSFADFAFDLSSPCGFVGTTSLVEYTTEPPYLSVQRPPESRENPYAVDGMADDGTRTGTDPE